MIIVEAGHYASAPGALGYDEITEFRRTSYLKLRVIMWLEHFQKRTIGLHGSTMGVSKLDANKRLQRVVSKINQLPGGSRFASLHFNNNNPKASGSEVFINRYTSNSNRKRASWMVYHLSNELNIPLRRIRSNRSYKYSHEAYVGGLGILDRTDKEGILVEVCFLNENDLLKYKGQEDRVAFIIALGLMHDFKEKNEPQYEYIRLFHKLKQIKLNKL